MTVDEALEEAAKSLAARDYANCRLLCNSVLRAEPRHPRAIELFRAIPGEHLYVEEFYEGQSPGSYQSAYILLGHLFDCYRPGSMADFGAGVGTWLTAARDLGVRSLLGIEGPWVRDKLPPDSPQYRFQDLNQPVQLESRVDLAMSVEVAEHLLPARSAGFVDDLCRASDLVLFGAAMPHQGGSGHLNERLASFWVAEFERNGYACHDFLRAAVWFNAAVEPWYAQNTFLFVRKGDARAAKFPTRPLLDVYHPALVNGEIVQHFERGWDEDA